MSSTDFYKIFQDQIRLQDNITIVDDLGQFKINAVKDGVIMVWVNWSIGYLNCKYSIEYLQKKNYRGQIFIIDIDSIQADTQKNIFNSKLHGWGEMFLLRDGQIVERFLGKESSVAFKTYIDKFLDIR